MAGLTVNLTDSLPMMPIVPQIIKSFAESDEDFDLPGFVESIQHEPTVSAKLLGYANSAANRAGREVISVQDAIMRLGLVQTKSIVLALVVNSQFDTKQCAAYKPDAFWFSTMMRAGFARCILPFTPQSDCMMADQAYSLSLVSDLGLLLLVSQHPAELNELLKNDAETPVTPGLRKLFEEHDHHYFSGLLLEYWGLPESYIEAVGHIGDDAYRGQYQQQTSLLRMANHMFKQTNQDDEISDEKVEAFGITLTRSALDQIMICINAQKRFIQSMADHMGH